MGHLGLTPQSVHVIGGMRQVRGRGDEGERIIEAALGLQDAGAFAVVAEAVPSALGKQLAEALTVPVVGIGAGPDVDAQILVWQDLVGLTPDPSPRFVRRYADLRGVLTSATKAYVDDVRSGDYPSETESY
jgi:3-methyl-2-oxobutanoate hydroxymethyltransferase